MTEQTRNIAGATHAVPLVSQPPRGERQRITRVDFFGDSFIAFGKKLRAPGYGRKDAVFVQSGFADSRAVWQWPSTSSSTFHP